MIGIETITDIKQYISIVLYTQRDRMPKTPKKELTSIQLTTTTRDRLYKLKFRKTYDEFLQELCDLYEESQEEEE